MGDLSARSGDEFEKELAQFKKLLTGDEPAEVKSGIEEGCDIGCEPLSPRSWEAMFGLSHDQYSAIN